MGLSAYFHQFNCQCSTKFFYLQKLDFAGIATMVAGSVTPPFYYGFICNQATYYRWFYLGTVWICAIIALVCVIIPAFAKIHWVKAVAWSLAISSIIPGFVHLY